MSNPAITNPFPVTPSAGIAQAALQPGMYAGPVVALTGLNGTGTVQVNPILSSSDVLNPAISYNLHVDKSYDGGSTWVRVSLLNHIGSPNLIDKTTGLAQTYPTGLVHGPAMGLTPDKSAITQQQATHYRHFLELLTPATIGTQHCYVDGSVPTLTPVHQSWSPVQSASAQSSGATTGALNVALNGVTTGNTLFAGGIAERNPFPTLSISDGTNTYNPDINDNNGVNQSDYQWHAENVTGGNLTIGVTPNASAFTALVIGEASGGATSSLDGTNKNAATGTSINTGSITPAVANEIFVGTCTNGSGTNAGSPTQNWGAASWGRLAGSATTEAIEMSYLVGSGTSAQTPAWSWTGTFAGVCVGASYKPSTGAAANPHLLLLVGCGI